MFICLGPFYYIYPGSGLASGWHIICGGGVRFLHSPSVFLNLFPRVSGGATAEEKTSPVVVLAYRQIKPVLIVSICFGPSAIIG